MKKFLLTILFLVLILCTSHSKEKRGTALVLSGGGARGISQIGVLKELERQKIKIDYIVGTSIGAVIGGLYCSGYSADEVEQIILNANWDDLLTTSNFYNRDKMFIDQKKYYDRKLINLRFDNFKFQTPQAISNGYHFSEFIQQKILESPYAFENNFDSLRIPFRAISMDIVQGNVYTFKDGDLMTAMRASTTVPLRFTPVVIDSMILIDGGPVANIPVLQAIEQFNPKTIIAVNTTSNIYKYSELDNPINIADQVVSVLMEENKKKAKELSDIFIEPDLESISNVDFDNLANLIRTGEEAVSRMDLSSFEKYDSQIDVELTKQFILNNINIKGNSNTDEVYILSEFDLKKGDSVAPELIYNLWQSLYSTELFSQVRITTKKLDSNRIDLTINVEEKGTQLVLLGARVDNERNTQLEIDFLRENVLNTGTRALLGLSGGARNQSAILSLSNPKIFNLPINFNVTGYYNNKIYRIYGGESISNNKYYREQIGEYNVEEYGFNVATGTNFDKQGKINVGFQLGKQRSYNRDDEPSQFKSVSTFFFRTLIDSKNKSNFATKGTLVDLNFESNLLSLENDVNFSKLEFVLDAYLSPIEDFTVNPFLMFGVGDKTTPLTEFWGLGGQDNFLGMREFERIGRQIYITSMEFRYKLPFQIFFDTYISARYDIGGVWTDPEQIRFANLRQGIGSTLSFDTPIGPAKFSLGNSFYFLNNPNRVIYGPLLGYFAIGINL